ncbi:MAG: AAA family ATPase [Myxococcota bacterium]|jgi:putative ATP-dependent endonuclease of OLD family|nr:AAA family ATPase [Myxococcota bacterium]
MTAPAFGLRLAAVRIENFKSLRDVALAIEPETTVLIGENNSGKTSFLEALDVAFGRRQAQLTDLYDGPDGRAEHFVIDLRFEPGSGEEFGQGVVDKVGNAIRVLTEPQSFVIRLTVARSATDWGLSLSRSYVNGWADNAEEASTLQLLTEPHVGRDILDLLHFEMLDARRDVVEQLRNRRTYWGRTAAKVELDPATKSRLEGELRTLGQELTESNTVLTQLRTDLTSLSDVFSGQASVELEALPRRVDDLVRAMDIVITSTNSSAFSVEHHGMGTRSLAALLVFRSYINVVRHDQRADHSLSVAAFEEPEAHLHPQSQRAVFELLAAIGGQRIVSTHSAHIASIAAPEAYRLFRKVGALTRVAAVSPYQMSQWNREQVRRLVQLQNPEVLFARVVGVFEGQTEAAAFPVLARAWWGERGADGKGVSFVFTAGAGSAKHIIPLLDVLQIPWVMFCDGDDGGVKGLRAASAALGRTLDARSPEVVQLPLGHAFETYVVDVAGCLAEAVAAVNAHPDGDLAAYKTKRQGSKRKDDSIRDYTGPDGERLACLDFMKEKKGTLGALLAEELVNAAADSPQTQLPELIRAFFSRIDGRLS